MEVNAKILVTGATGTIGREIIRQLTVRGIAVRALVRQAERIRWDTPLAEQAEGDLDDVASLERSMRGIEKVIVIAELHEAMANRVANVEAMANRVANVIAAARKARVRHLVRFSTLGADCGSPCQSFCLHGEADAMVIASDLAFTILRPNAFFQELLSNAASIKSSSRLVSAVGTGRQSLVDVRDLAEAAMRVLTEPNHAQHIYTLTGPEALSQHDIARELTSLLARPIVYQPLTPKEMEQSLLAAGVSVWRAHAMAEVQAAMVTDAFAESTPELSVLLARPARRFAEFVRENATAFL